ncbi:N-acetyltransferase family protein [Sphingobacterium puteale]|uniref:N-acetyltransferase family protein n=1 Tax=Sphingobacterium puteale TaxID=2420510 RepID=A0A420VRT9_9SPHI|nr:GNAT family N-acetyltransferase [Sphingobacterium puteale]RKO69005.1 N-acetyltransferase family protein [Sphingobacterium puteale]
MSQLIFRDARQADLPLIVAIYNTTIASRMVTADTSPVSVESRQKWFDEHSPSKRPLWLVEDENSNILGWVSFQSFYGRPAYDATVEISIYLDEQQRGRGLGKQILQYCIKQAPALGIHTLLGFIFAHNVPSITLFEKMGFQEWANLPNIATLDHVERSLKIMGKRVS